MKDKNNNILPYVYIALGCIGVVGLLIIVVPIIYDHYRDIHLLSNAININVMNHDEKLANINRQLIESRSRNFSFTMLFAIFPVTIFLYWIIRGIVLLKPKKELETR